MEIEEYCGICRELFTMETRVSVLGCRHIFHTLCEKDWGKQCPLCRKWSRRRPRK